MNNPFLGGGRVEGGYWHIGYCNFRCCNFRWRFPQKQQSYCCSSSTAAVVFASRDCRKMLSDGTRHNICPTSEDITIHPPPLSQIRMGDRAEIGWWVDNFGGACGCLWRGSFFIAGDSLYWNLGAHVGGSKEGVTTLNPHPPLKYDQTK